MFDGSFPLLHLIWSMFIIFLWLGWFMLLFRVFGDIFRSRTSGVSKALWSIFVILLPFLGVFIYLIAHGGQMHDREAEIAARQLQVLQDDARRQSASTADELAKLATLHGDGVITEAEFAAQKARLLA